MSTILTEIILRGHIINLFYLFFMANSLVDFERVNQKYIYN